MLKACLYQEENLKNLFQKSLVEVEAFFDIIKPYNKPVFILLENRKSINYAYGQETGDWVVGWNHGKYIFLLNPKNYEKESKHKYSDEEYSQLIKHEITHYIYNALVGTNNPRWLLEGIGMVASGQIEKYKEKPTEFKSFLYYYNKMDSKIYKESGFLVKILFDKFGKEKLLGFIKTLRGNKNPQDVEKSFKEVYNLDLNYPNMNKLLKELD